jgi:hypothetical protein
LPLLVDVLMLMLMLMLLLVLDLMDVGGRYCPVILTTGRR